MKAHGGEIKVETKEGEGSNLYSFTTISVILLSQRYNNHQHEIISKALHFYFSFDLYQKRILHKHKM